MSSGTKALVALGWAAFGVGAIALGVALDMHSLMLPGFLLIFLGLGMASHVQQAQRFESQDEGKRSPIGAHGPNAGRSGCRVYEADVDVHAEEDVQ
jgi:hypothetical protein